ncbi:MAG: helix-turn-helix transcriptional regulator [Paracraurococcus sp.]
MPVVAWLSQKSYRPLGRHLADLRRQAGVTQDELASRLRKPQPFVSAYENGQRRVDLLEFLAITDALAQEPVQAFTALLQAVRGPSRAARRTSS